MLASSVLLAVLAAQPTQPSTHAPTQLVWSTPSACPDDAAARRAIEHYAARSLDDTGEVLRAAEVEIVEDSDGFRLRLRMAVGQGNDVERVLRDRSCTVLAETAVLMIAVTIDPTAATRAPPPEPPASEPVAAPTKPAPAPPKPAPPKPASSPGPRARDCDVGRSQLARRDRDLRPCGSLELRGGVQLGVLPQTYGFGVGLDLALTWARLRLEIGGNHWFRRSARVADDPPRGGDLRLSSGGLGACARLGRGAIEVPLCGGIEAGAIYGRGVGIAAPRTERVPWVAASTGPRVMWVIRRRWLLIAGADLVVPLARYRFQVEGLGVVHRVGPVGGRFRLGLGVRL